MDFRQLPLSYEGRVESQHLDHMGHMNVMWYTHFFDRAIWNWYETFDFGVEYHTQSGLGSFALEMHTRYLVELRLGEEFQIYIRMLARNAKLFHYILFMQRSSNGDLCATEELLGITIDMSTRRSAPMPERIAATFDQLIAEHSALSWPAPVSGGISIK